ncbi:MAG: UDP-N-acetylglucosamine 1-carboxyvinyltransferase, partial [Gemmatimonadota bacterium]
MAPFFTVEGGHKLRGTVRPAGNKNAALPILAGTLLADGPVVLHNVPKIRDVETLIELLQSQGAKVAWTSEHTVAVDARGVRPADPDPALCQKI